MYSSILFDRLMGFAVSNTPLSCLDNLQVSTSEFMFLGEELHQLFGIRWPRKSMVNFNADPVPGLD
jgi:hypothetical protein